jgi:hypothetical protein
MYQIERIHCDAAIQAILKANIHLLETTVAEALEKTKYGKGDTICLDARPETTITEELREFDNRAILVTEEANPPDLKSFFSITGDVRHQPTIYMSDPTDRTVQFKEYLKNKDPNALIGDILQKDNTLKEWEKNFGKPVSITGSFSAITCLRFGVPISTVLLNFITQEIFVACKSGIFQYKLPPYKRINLKKITLDTIENRGHEISFYGFDSSPANIENMKNFATYLGTEVYQKNFEYSNILKNTEKAVYKIAGGPSRPLYLSTVATGIPRVGFILANGEKIIEWIHWIPFLRFGRHSIRRIGQALRLFEISENRPWTRDGVLMSTPIPYSIFKSVSTSERGNERMIINVDRFQDFPNPSKIRSTLLMAPISNTWINGVLEFQQYRRIEFLRV